MPFITDKLKDLNERQQVQMEEEEHGKRIVTRFRFNVAQVMNKVRLRIFGQEEVLKRLEDMMNIIWADIADPNRPLYTALFLGPTGVGKTETVRVLSEAIHGTKDDFCRIDMNTLVQEHYAAALTGSPPGYVGSKDGNSLFQADKIEGSYGKPGVVLFDELEKANNQVIYSLLNVMDNGLMKMTSGEKTINFRNSMIFMTSNIGSQEIMDYANGGLKFTCRKLLWFLWPAHWGKTEHDFLKALVMKKIENRFTPEFINRFDDIFIFQWLPKQELEGILNINIDHLNHRIKKYGCNVSIDEGVKQFLLQKGFDKRYGARLLKRTIQKYIEVPLASLLGKRGQNDGFTVIQAVLRDGKPQLLTTKSSESSSIHHNAQQKAAET
jgi:ATP-dependent Clp protease ATP-binding subunit ClpA